MVTYTFSANTKIKSSEVNQNFTDCVSPFVNWTTWTPTIYKTDSTSVMPVTVNLGEYTRRGDVFTGHLNVSGIGDPGGARLYILMPFALKNAAERFLNVFYGNANGAILNSGLFQLSGLTTKLTLFCDSTNLANTWAGSNNSFEGTFEVRIDT